MMGFGESAVKKTTFTILSNDKEPNEHALNLSW